MNVREPYPHRPAERDHWILTRRSPRNALDPRRPHAFFAEDERAESGEIVRVATVFLTNRECAWRCVFCDLWKNTLTESVPVGAIPEQIDFALTQLGGESCRHLKLYNSGSFFDLRAIPATDHAAIARQAQAFEHVVVECHPKLVGDRVLRFRDQLGDTTSLEVAMGLETAHPEVLEKLNKRMTPDDFARAARFLRDHGVAVRTFVLVPPPFLAEDVAWAWVRRSIDFAFDNGVNVVSLIPTRMGNGALEALAEQGEFTPPSLEQLEAMHDYGVGLGRGRVFADAWDLEKFSTCSACFAARRDRLRETNLRQVVIPPIGCELHERPSRTGFQPVAGASSPSRQHGQDALSDRLEARPTSESA